MSHTTQVRNCLNPLYYSQIKALGKKISFFNYQTTSWIPRFHAYIGLCEYKGSNLLLPFSSVSTQVPGLVQSSTPFLFCLYPDSTGTRRLGPIFYSLYVSVSTQVPRVPGSVRVHGWHRLLPLCCVCVYPGSTGTRVCASTRVLKRVWVLKLIKRELTKK